MSALRSGLMSLVFVSVLAVSIGAQAIPPAQAIELAAVRYVRPQVRTDGFHVVIDPQSRQGDRALALVSASGTRLATPSERLACAGDGRCALLPNGLKVIAVGDPSVRGDTAIVVVQIRHNVMGPRESKLLGGSIHTVTLVPVGDAWWKVVGARVSTS